MLSELSMLRGALIFLSGCCLYEHRPGSAFDRDLMDDFTRPVNPAANEPEAPAQVTGDDGTFGWVNAGEPSVEMKRAVQDLAEKQCTFLSYGEDEIHATCGDVRVLVRHDKDHVFRLCAPRTPKAACEATWERDPCVVARMLCAHKNAECAYHARACERSR